MNYGKITSIEEVRDIEFEIPASPKGGFSGRIAMDGYKITAGDQTISVLISNEQNCCEAWGYIASEDDLSGFVGESLLDVRLTDTALYQKSIDKSDYYTGCDDMDCGGIQFVDFVTDKGIFQLAVYNAHNGYYGHPIVVAIDDNVLISDTL